MELPDARAGFRDRFGGCLFDSLRTIAYILDPASVDIIDEGENVADQMELLVNIGKYLTRIREFIRARRFVFHRVIHLI